MARLVLSRKPGEALIIGGPARVTIVEFRGNVVKLAIEADSDVPVDREEIFVKKAAASGK